MTYADAIRSLYDLQLFGAKLGLNSTRRLAQLAENPQDQLRFIHVAGTNGKGSTCAMLESIYRAAGLRVGLFTSPHLISFTERIQINRQPIPETEVARRVAEIRPLLKSFTPTSHPTFFEAVTVMALSYFAEQQCDLVIWETGLGGRLDATNIVTPIASVITSVELDHEAWLGSTLEQIAAEKAGIIKPKIPVIATVGTKTALNVVRDIAHEREAPLTLVSPSDVNNPPLNSIQLPLIGQHQKFNAALATATIRTLSDQLPVTDRQLIDGLTRVSWPGRIQILQGPCGQTIVLDGAHNPSSASALREALTENFPDTQPTLLLGALSDKDWSTIANVLAPIARRILLTPVNHSTTLPPASLLSVCERANPRAQIDCCSSLQHALTLSATDPFLVITGSIYLVGEAMEHLQLSPLPRSNERGLNEWRIHGV